MGTRWTTAALVVSLILPAGAACAWNDTGHMLVAEIAYRHMNGSIKTRANRLVRALKEPQSSTFVTASCYMDDLRQRTHEFDDWHYIDQPFSTDGTRPQVGPKPQNVVWALGQCVQTLRDPSAPEKERAQKLAFLIHLVGDIHQPLHAATRVTRDRPEGDRGGNLFPITGVEATELHAYWDAGLGLFPPIARPLTATTQKLIKQLADQIEATDPPYSFRDRTDLDFQHWADESKAFAQVVAYGGGLTENSTPSRGYVRRAKAAVSRRIALAGYRLAELLNAVLR